MGDAVAASLRRRPGRSLLVERNVLRSTVLPAGIQARLDALELQRRRDSISKRLRDRPARRQLVETNIMRDPKLPASVAETQLELRKRQKMDALNQHLRSRRPSDCPAVRATTPEVTCGPSDASDAGGAAAVDDSGERLEASLDE